MDFSEHTLHTQQTEHASKYSLRNLHPGNFAIVMASGILSSGFTTLGQPLLAELFYFFTLCSGCTLLALIVLRLLRHLPAVRQDLLNPRLVFGYFTLVATTDIVGILLHARGHTSLALGCWTMAFVVWCSLLYLAFSVLTFVSHEHNVNIVHGGWLITIVGTQSLVLLGARIAPDLGQWANFMLVEIHMLWGLGLVFYGIFVTLFCYRIFFLTLQPQDVSPLFGVIMGAAAISANAGTSLLQVPAGLPFLREQHAFINGVTMMCWAWATWWLPMLLLFAVWKHVAKRLPLAYEPVLWSFVFPLGMYAVASARLGLAAEFPPLQLIATLMIWIACAVWLAVFAGLVHRLSSLLRA
ncbi:tellurite resistance/C4-dicarboxylate transporter family protein [Chitinilyticum piscinae]|uniref:Tellurite resistance/C4-dicarboxylate transporter family protein n=1 Tax=Chitinilyticum piscinae TaxID=2866724 RepID=A0A8J7K9W0_9NEIS|nr:tellurite resistance/C4-dicarboxylate transporter family protein [Chitinilyticum piscinae]MBE9608749.1 tellurite resistance/C4-dicarboxylate transporter family protein [Chitinilyticum piscinae]